MSIEFAFRPIDKWPQKQTPHHLRKSPFKAGWSNTMPILRRELEYLKAKNAVIMLAVSESEIRLDGLPRADARPDHPGVIIAFDSQHGPLKLPCDTCRSWQDNARAIAFHLAHLRQSALYGVGRFGEQYTGWKQLPPAVVTPPRFTVDSAAAWMATVMASDYPADLLVKSVDNFKTAYRASATKLHPDTNNGIARPEWHLLQQAAEVLRRHHGIA
jgi:hypothetical protein